MYTFYNLPLFFAISTVDNNYNNDARSDDDGASIACILEAEEAEVVESCKMFRLDMMKCAQFVFVPFPFSYLFAWTIHICFEEKLPPQHDEAYTICICPLSHFIFV